MTGPVEGNYGCARTVGFIGQEALCSPPSWNTSRVCFQVLLPQCLRTLRRAANRDEGSTLSRARLPSPPEQPCFSAYTNQEIALTAHCRAFFEFACFVVAGFCFVL